MTSGSQKYVVGAPRGEKSRGGVVIVLGGATGPACCAATGAATIAPAPAASACTMVRRENALSSLSVSVTKPSRRNDDGRLIRHWGEALRQTRAMARHGRRLCGGVSRC